MSYGADFAAADPANAPLDPPLFIGADPVVWGALLLALAAALLLGWWLGARSSPRRPDASRAIWSAIDAAAKEAMKADDNALKGRAEHLLKVVRGRLGATLALSKGLSGAVGKLQDAVDGKTLDHAKGHDPHKPAPGKDHDAPKTVAETHEAAHAEAAHAASAHPAAAANVTIVTVTPGVVPAPAPSPGHKPGHDPDPKPGKRDMTQREQTDALRLAVAAFNQHWRDQNERIGELRAAALELSGGPSARG